MSLLTCREHVQVRRVFELSERLISGDLSSVDLISDDLSSRDLARSRLRGVAQEALTKQVRHQLYV